jgi:hypothetical protein
MSHVIPSIGSKVQENIMNSRNQIVSTEGGHSQTKRKPEARHYSLSRRNRLKIQHTQETQLAKEQRETITKLSPTERRAARVARKNSKQVV